MILHSLPATIMYSYMGTHSDPSEEALTRNSGERAIGTGGVGGPGGVGLGGYGTTASPVHATGAPQTAATTSPTSPSNPEGTPLVTYRVKSGSRGAEHGTLLLCFLFYCFFLRYGQFLGQGYARCWVCLSFPTNWMMER